LRSFIYFSSVHVTLQRGKVPPVIKSFLAPLSYVETAKDKTS